MAAPDLKLDPSDGPFGVAVSGGADSLALLLLCYYKELPVRAVTVDHGLRPDSAQEACWVSDLCAARDIPHDILTLSLSDGRDLQNRARQARYQALAGWAKSHGLASVLLGHTANDIAETFLMRLSDGAGLDGLASMATRFVRNGVVFLRPIHDLYKPDVRRIVAEYGLTPIEDPSNDNPRFERVRIRKMMAELGIPAERIVASARALRQARTSAEIATAQTMAQIAQVDRGDLLVRRDQLRAVLANDPEQARRLLLRGLHWINGHPYAPRRAEQEEMLRRVAGGQATTLAGCLLTFERQHLRLSREPAAAARAAAANLGAQWDGRWTIRRSDPGQWVGDGGSGGVAPQIRMLGEAVSRTPWRDTGLPRRSLMSSPAIWAGDDLLAAPLAGFGAGWQATCKPLQDAAE